MMAYRLKSHRPTTESCKSMNNYEDGWTENEFEAFRRNRILQAYHRKDMAELGTQMHWTWRSNISEVHKFKYKNSKYIDSCTSTPSTQFLKNLLDATERELDFSFNNMAGTETGNRKITSSARSRQTSSDKISRKKAKLSVTFSLFNEIFEDSRSHNSNMRQEFFNDEELWRYVKNRTSSAQIRKQTTLYHPGLERCQTNINLASSFQVEETIPKSFGTLSGTKRYKFNPVTEQTARGHLVNKARPALQLKAELRRRAKQRKQKSEKTPLTIENMLTFQREQNVLSREKVRQYLDNLNDDWWTQRSPKAKEDVSEFQ